MQRIAEQNFREAFQRLKDGKPERLAFGSLISQNNVAKEAGCDPSALKKSRFPGLVSEIKSYLVNHPHERDFSERQRILIQRQRSRSARETINDLRAQRDFATSLLGDANAQISMLTLKVRDLQARLDALQSTRTISAMPSPKIVLQPRSVT